MKWKQTWLGPIWMISVTLLLGYALTTTGGDRHMPSLPGWIAFAIAGLSTWAMFDWF